MKILKILYICWVGFCIFGWIISPQIGHNPDRFEEFLIMFGWIIAPLIIYYVSCLIIVGKKIFLAKVLFLVMYYPFAILLFLIFD